MKKFFLLIIIALVTYSSSFAIGGFKVVIKKPGAAVDVQVRIVDYAPTGPNTEFTGATVLLTPNASGIIVASVPETPAILATAVTSNYLVEVWVGNPLVLSSQQRLDEMIFEQAQTGLTDNDGNLTIEPGKELKFPEPTASGTNFTSFKSPALAADVEYTLPIDDGGPNQYLKTDGSGIMSWDDAKVSTNSTIDGDGSTGSVLGLADDAVTTIKIADGAIATAKIATSAVTDTKIADDAVTTAKIADGAVTTNKIGSSAVTDVKIGDSAVTTAKINNAAVTTDKIANGAVTEVKLADDAVATAKIANKAVTAAKISPGATNGHVLTVSGTDAVWAAPAGGGGGGCNIYGDGSAGDITISANTDWSTTPPTNGNYMFNSLIINSGVTLTVPSGTVIQCKTTFSNSGTITVKHGTLGRAWAGNTDGGNTDVLGNTMASRKAYPNSETYRRLTNLGLKAGSAGTTGGFVGTETFGGNGGGTFTVLAATGITNSGTINASGQTPTPYSAPPNDKPGCGGGGGGFVLLASNANITNSGTVNSSGGNGQDAGSSSADYGGGGGGGGLIHFISPNADVVGGTNNVSGGTGGTDNGTGSSGGDGGASVGNGGLGSDVSDPGTAGAILRTKVADACSFINR